MQTIDARGLSCPQPVILAQKALSASPAQATVLVDNRTAQQNVTRFAQQAGYRVSTTQSAPGEYLLTLEKTS